MEARALSAVGKAGGAVAISVDDAELGGVVLAQGADRVNLTGAPARLFKALLKADAPLGKDQIKARIWKTQSRSDGTVQNAITGLRRELLRFFNDPVTAAGKPARYALNLGLPQSVKAAPPPRRWPERLIVCARQSLCYGVAAALALQSIEIAPGAGVVLAAGRTAGEIFHAAIALAQKRRFPGLEQARYFIDMETLGVGPAHAASRHAFVRRSFIDPLRGAGYAIDETRVAFFCGYVDQEPSHFEAFVPLLRGTPLALHLVSVSPQGGLIGHSAGTTQTLDDMISDCRMTTLSDIDRRYIDHRMPSAVMLSIGLLNLLRADRLLIPVYHEAKADILRVMLATDPDPAIPATLLKLHGRATVITTRAMAEKAFNGDGAVEIDSERDAMVKLGLAV